MSGMEMLVMMWIGIVIASAILLSMRIDDLLERVKRLERPWYAPEPPK